ncbi:EI24 domain-containing protein [Roseomonas sp. BN140053]|uniref:EI24 domain-containing protein n=1 Tax=Roseomonas sp. BN140053 TaxID=3391898 RepID=UPI0039E9A2AD
MRAVAASLLLPWGQLTEPGFRWPLIKGLLGAIVAFGALVLLAGWGVGALAGGTGWLATLAATLGGALVLVSAVWLFVPVALAISGLFVDEVAEAVERQHFPGLPPAAGASLTAQVWAALGLAARVLLLTLLVLPLAFLLPGVGLVLLWAVAAWSLGQGFFEGVAQRRMTVAASRALWRRRRPEVLAVGAALAGLAAVPLLNLLVPVLGTAAMTHLLHRGRDGTVAGAPPPPRRVAARAGAA